MYADELTDSMMAAIGETNRRRAMQEAYNREHGITPQSVRTAVRALLEITEQAEQEIPSAMDESEKQALIRQLEDQMLSAAAAMEFEKAAKFRDQLFALRGGEPVEKAPVRHRREKMRHH